MRKLTALLLALLMLTMPLTAMAEDNTIPFGEDYLTKALEAGRRVHYEVTLGEMPEELTSDPDSGAAVKALFDSLTFVLDEQGNEGAVSIGFKKADGSIGSVLDVGVLVDGTDAYIKSNLLGANAIVIGADDIYVVLGRLMSVLVDMGAMDADEAMSMVAELPAMIEMIKSQMVTITPEDLMNLDYSALQETILPLLMKAEQVEMTMQPKNCDAAASEYLLVITQDDAVKVVTGLLTFIKDNPVLMKVLESQSGYNQTMYLYEDEEMPTFEQQIDELIAELQSAEDTGETVQMRFWLDENDKEVCVQVYPVDAEGVVAETSVISYNRLTMNDKVAHSFNFGDDYEMMTIELVLGADSLRASLSMDENGGPYMSMLLDVTSVKTENGINTSMFIEIADYSYDYEYDYDDYDYDYEVSEEVVRIDCQEETVLNGVDFVSNAEVSISVNGQKMITAYCVASTEDPAPSIKDGETVRLAALTDADFANWFAGVMNSIQSWPMTLIMNMPAELVQMMMQEGM